MRRYASSSALRARTRDGSSLRAMSDADVDRASRWLYRQRGLLADRHRDSRRGGVGELLDRALSGVDALTAGDAISGESAAWWRDELARAAAGRERVIVASDEVRDQAEGLATELLAAVPEDPEWDDVNSERFEGAVELLSAIGAVDPVAWDALFRERTGRLGEEEEFEEVRRLNAGGTEAELDAVIQGPSERRSGHRLIAALRFADGVSFLIDKDGACDFDWPDWRLTDDLGTDYMGRGSSGGDHDEHVSFRTAIPDEACWIELVHDSPRRARRPVAVGL